MKRQSSAHNDNVDSSSQLDQLAREMATLGSETQAQRRAKTIVPWIASFALHGLVILLGFAITWTAVRLQPEQEPTIIIADFNALSYDPVAMLDLDEAELQEEIVQDMVERDLLLETINDRLSELERDPISMISDAASVSPISKFAPEPQQGRAEFVGLSSSNARRIVYVIDASASMTPYLPIVVQELARSLAGLTPQQQFSVIFFQDDKALVSPPASRLSVASESEKGRVIQWIDKNIRPTGTSNPSEAIKKAFSFKPEVIFLLSEDITGEGIWEVDQRDLLALLDRLNPVDPRTGRRKTTINCIQFLDPDPLDTLKKIAEIHGGPKGYKFLDRKELGLSSR